MKTLYNSPEMEVSQLDMSNICNNGISAIEFTDEEFDDETSEG